MQKFNPLYELQHIHEIRREDQEELNVKILGIFSSKKQINEAIKVYKSLPGFKDKCKVAGDYDDLIEGFFISPIPVGITYWDGGFTPSRYASKQEEIEINLPSWFSKDTTIQSVETSTVFAEQIMEQKCGTKEYPRGPQSEFYQIKKFKELHEKQLL